MVYHVQNQKNARLGFTLIELSIVLVIIGLIVGGVLVGSELIRQAELRSVITDTEKFRSAVNAFRLKFNCVPGDCLNATDYWPQAADCTLPAVGEETCNGNGNGLVDQAYTANYYEMHRFWQQLGNAQLVGGHFTGVGAVAGPPNGLTWYYVKLGVNAPASRISGAGWTTFYLGTQTGHPQWFDASYQSVFFFGDVLGYTSQPALTPEEAYSVDMKMDDGRPGAGVVLTWKALLNPNCTTSDVGSVSLYDLTKKDRNCSLIFANVY